VNRAVVDFALRNPAGTGRKTLERLSQVTLPAGLQPQLGTDWSPVGQIFWYTLESANPEYDLMEQKSIEDWVLEPQYKFVPNVVDVSSFGGPTREYQVRIDPEQLINYGLSIGQVEQALQNNNVNSGGSSIQEGGQQINIRELWLVNRTQDWKHRAENTKRHAGAGAGCGFHRARAEDPPGTDRQSHSSAEWKDYR
jgi:cobalt-zinc-cadmium resistance protein CzcA